MAQKNIDFGSFPDDPSADAIRTAFQKTQENFTELFSGLQDQAVISVNKTPGAGITVNSPTGNVVVTANIACVQVATSTLSIGRDANGSNATSITASSQTLVIDLPSTVNNVANVNLTNTLTSNTVNVNLQLNGNVGVFSGNVTAANLITSGTITSTGNISAGNIDAGNAVFVSNVSAGNINAAVANITGNTSTNNLSVTNQANVGGNLNVTGNITSSNYFVGNGYYLTDVIAAPGPKIVNGTSYTNIAVSGGVIESVVNGYNIQTLSALGANINGYATVTGNLIAANANLGNSVEANFFTGRFYGTANSATNANNATTAGTVTTNAQPNITSVGSLSSLDVTGTLTAGNIFANAGTIRGNLLTGTLTTNAQPNITSVGTLTSLSVTGNTSSNNFVGRLANGNSNVNIPSSNGNVTISSTGNSNVVVITGTGQNVAGYLTVTGNILASGTGSGLGGKFVTINGAVTGNLNTSSVNGNLGLTIAASTYTDNSAAANTTIATSAPHVISSPLLAASNANVTLGNAATLAIKGAPNAGANIAITNAYALMVETGASHFGGNVSASNFIGANLVSANFVTGTLTTAAQPNITSVGTLTSLSVTGNVTAGNVYSNSGTIGASLLTGTLTTNAQPNVTSVGTLTSLGVNGNIVAVNITANTGVFSGNGSGLSAITGANVTGVVANANYAAFAGQSNNANTAGTVTTNAQPNITSVGSLTTLTVVGNISSGNIDGGNLVKGNFVQGTLTTASQPNITSVGILTGLGVNGNITAVNISANTGVFSGNGSGLSAISGANVTGQVANALVAGTVYTAAQPNITSVGNLTSLIVTGNLSSGNANLGNLATANFFQGDGSLLTNISVAAGAFIFNGNSNVYVDLNGNVRTSVSGNSNIFVVTGTGANVTGNLGVTNNVSVTGTMSATNIAGNIVTAAQPNITSLGNLTGLTVSGITNLGAVANVKIAGGTTNQVLVSTGEGSNLTFVTASGLTFAPGTSTQVLFNDSGSFAANANLTFDKSTGTLSTHALSVNNSATFGNVFANSGTIRGSLLTGTLTTASQPNVTSLGTLTGLIVGGNINSGNISGGNAVSANFFIGSGANLTNIPGANVTGVVANATAANTILVNSSSNTSVYPAFHTRTSNGYAEITFNTGISANLSNNSITATTFVGSLSGTATSATTAGTVTTNAQPNITSVGTLTSLIVGGNINAGNISGGNAVNSNHFIGRHIYLTDTTTTFDPSVNINQTWNNVLVNFTTIRANVTDTLSNTNSLLIDLLVADSSKFSVNKAGNVVFTGSISGNGAGLSSITGANVTGTVANATYATSAGTATTATTAGTVTTNAQPNITSVGTLTSLTSSGNIQGANVTATAYHLRSVATGIVAAGINQGTATVLSKEFNVVSTALLGNGVILPSAVAGMAITIINSSANALLVYPHVGGDINGGAANAAFTQPAGATLQFITPNTTDWYTVGATFA